ncbi:MAG: adenylate/guanylate cyclase domain-containing protein, partial [Acidimicrobiia bacterium]|nr:adenylate/guanylate cyclase domain-containing protein [Acidimicrobiia bacterium]
TFLFTDLEGSTRLWEEHPDAMRAALARHDEILRDAVEDRGGHVVKTTGDGLHAAFGTAHDAVAAAIEAQRGLDAEPWTLPDPLLVRMGIHTGEADLREGDYFGTAVNRAARVSAAAHGGQVIVSHATEELVRDHLPAEVTLEDLGEHHLRDLARPERVFQVRAPGLTEDFPPLRSLEAFPGNLPARQTSFVGRDKELGKIADALRSAPLVTLTGVGGVGKTRLAVQVAAQVLPHYPDGAWLCELATADSPDTLIQVVASALAVPSRSGMDLAQAVVEYLRPKHLLLVLDNCEHLLDPAGDLADRIVEMCPNVRLLATSREGLAVDGEQVIPLRSLPLPGEHADAGAIEAADAVQLFVERARAAQADFSVAASDLAAVAEICRRLDGMPLAIELAAARAVAMSPSEIASLLDERFRLLTGGRRSAVERHQTLRATVDWSYGLLEERQRLVFDRLGVFAGTFDGAAATAVVGVEGIERFDVLDALTDLVAKSMVVAERTDDGTTRYHLLETLRQYAREQLDETGAADDWRRRHAEHYAAFAADSGTALLGPDEIAWRHRLIEDADNLRAAVTWALDRDDEPDVRIGFRIVAALHIEAAMRRASGVSAWAARALERAELMSPTERFDARCAR